MTLDAALVFHPHRGWYLAPSPELEQLVISNTPPGPMRSSRKP